MSADGVGRLGDIVKVRPPQAADRPEPLWDHAEVTSHRTIGDRYHRIALRSPAIAAAALAGQFVMITIGDGMEVVLPRPMAIHRRRPEAGEIEIVFAVLGRGTAVLAELAVGDFVTVTGPLGRGFELSDDAANLLLMGRGIGVGAVMGAAEDAVARGIETTAVLSAHRLESVIGGDDCTELGAAAIAVADEDGSSAVIRIERDLLARFAASPPDTIMVCGSQRLLDLALRLGERWGSRVQVSLEAHMACGIGYCHGCAAPIPTDANREGPLVCVDGPVFDAVSPLAATA
ncbi:iron-sulfur cluster-binding protein [Leifsonia poae]|uniref:iron-sulfur cluster-binding protein n=1 Tax=Leifsonia poae TaxID=110933 RepID=UPI001CC094DE|nr:dihydroorotate oxidase electron transfer subunit [Leifsonia poae]